MDIACVLAHAQWRACSRDRFIEGPMNPFDLSGKVAVVTGGNGGIGLAMAHGLVLAGASTIVVGRNAGKNERAVKELSVPGRIAHSLRADLSRADGCREMIAKAAAVHGRLDILVNNAGMNIRKPPQDYALQEWQAVIDTNLTGVFACCQAAYPHLKAAGRGKIINIGSMTSIFGASFAAPYSASKGAVVQLTRALASAWARDNIQVNAVLPGWIDTDLTRRARVEVPGLHEKVEARTPAGRWGVPGDLAGAAVFLASPASDFVTGVALPVDGGYSIQA
jgi:2-deoxy-D-gluconate 3-dehydrogenase